MMIPGDLVAVSMTLSCGPLETPASIVMMEINTISRQGNACYVSLCALENHPAFIAANEYTDIDGDIYDVEISYEERFVLDVTLTIEQYRELQSETQRTHTSDMYNRLLDRKRKRATADLDTVFSTLEDGEMAAIVLHSAPGIRTRARFYPRKE